MRFVDAHRATTAANPNPTKASRSSDLSHCFYIKAKSEDGKIDIETTNKNTSFSHKRILLLNVYIMANFGGQINSYLPPKSYIHLLQQNK